MRKRLTPEQKERMREYCRKWRAAHPGYHAMKKRERRVTHPGYDAMKSREWYAANPDKVAVVAAKSRCKARVRKSRMEEAAALLQMELH